MNQMSLSLKGKHLTESFACCVGLSLLVMIVLARDARCAHPGPCVLTGSPTDIPCLHHQGQWRGWATPVVIIRTAGNTPAKPAVNFAIREP